jgi:4-alpha-glucanotransferase
VPDGASPRDGAYLRYPLDDLLRLIALESWRHRAIVVGEDLGTVPAGFRERLAAAGLVGIRVLWFERRKAATPSDPAPFKLPEQWDANVAATTTTHDLPTVAGWWRGLDIDERARIGQSTAESAIAAHRERAADRVALWSAFQQAGLAPRDAVPSAPSCAPLDEALAFVARTPAALVTIPLEDLTGTAEQPNLPGTTTEHPNWRRRVAASVDALFADQAFVKRLAALAAARASAAPAENTDVSAATNQRSGGNGTADADTHVDAGVLPPRTPPT